MIQSRSAALGTPCPTELCQSSSSCLASSPTAFCSCLRKTAEQRSLKGELQNKITDSASRAKEIILVHKQKHWVVKSQVSLSQQMGPFQRKHKCRLTFNCNIPLFFYYYYFNYMRLTFLYHAISVQSSISLCSTNQCLVLRDQSSCDKWRMQNVWGSPSPALDTPVTVRTCRAHFKARKIKHK